MGFLDTLRRVFSDQVDEPDPEARRQLVEAWDLDEDDASEEGLVDPESDVAPAEPTGYDRRLWVKKLGYLIEEKLPVEDDAWHDFVAEAYALGYDQAWVQTQLRTTFEQLVRRVVADGVVTPTEHHKIELARAQMGLPEQEAEAVVTHIIAEAEKIFGRRIRKT